VNQFPDMTTFDTARPLRPRSERREINVPGTFARADEETPWEFTLVNLSQGGCRLTSEAPLRRGEEITLSLPDGITAAAVVRWRSGTSSGLSFRSLDTPKVQIARQKERVPAAMTVLVRRQGRKGQWLDATDFSPLGCCITFVEPPRPGQTLWVQLPGLESIEGEVRWVKDFRVGVSFIRPIHDVVFDLLIARWRQSRG